LFLQRLKLQLEQSAPLEIDGVNDELIVAARFIDRDAAVADHLLSVTDGLGQKTLLVFKENGAKLRPLIFEGKVAVPRVGPGEIGDFTTHPDKVELPLKKISDASADLGNGEYGRPRRCEGCWDKRLHFVSFLVGEGRPVEVRFIQ